MTAAGARAMPALVFLLLSVATAWTVWSFSDPLGAVRGVGARPAALILALGATSAFAAIGWLARTMTVPAAGVGTVLGLAIFAGAGWRGWLLLVASFLLAVLATRFGRDTKRRLGIGEAREGRRGAGNAWANIGVSAMAALAAAGGAPVAMAHLAMVAALAAAVSDTVASEVGKARSPSAWLLTSLTRVPAGTTGAVSVAGTVACAASSVLLGALAAALGLIPWSSVAFVAAIATVASLFEGVIGAHAETRGLIDNDGLNYLTALAAAVLAVAAWQG